MNRPRSPNVLLITADQLRADALGCYGNNVVKTPNIDRLAQLGVRFNRMFAAYPVCAPNRASIATGRYPSINGVRSNGICLPKNEQTLMDTLRSFGYFTCGSGKMHFQPQWRFPEGRKALVDPHPGLAHDPQPEAWEMPWYGFEAVQITEDNRVGPYARYLQEHGYDVWADPHSFSYPQHQCIRSAYPEKHHQTAWIADRSIDLLSGHDFQRPFFLWTSFVHPHHPFNPPAPYDTMYDPCLMPAPIWREGEDRLWPERYRRKHRACSGSHEAVGMCNISDEEWKKIKAYYYGMTSFIDSQVGRLLQFLESRSQLENTLIIFTTDHGEMLGDHHLIFKGTGFDQVTRMPLILSGPGIDAGGESRDTLASSIDLMPTVLDLCGAPAVDAVQGTSLVPAIHSPRQKMREEVLIEFGGMWRALRTEKHLIGWHGPGAVGELYELEKDPDCLYNLWDDAGRETLKNSLLEKMMEKIVKNVDPVPLRLGPC